MKISYKIVPTDSLELLSRNARYMEEPTYRRLVENIKRDGGLTSAPFCVQIDDKGERFKVISGNHRVQAARDAGINEILILYTDQPMTDSEMISRQLAHNAIEGKDDPVLLRELYDEINDVDWKEYTGLSEDQIRELEKLVNMTINPVSMSYMAVTMLFVDSEAKHLQEVFESIQKDLAGRDDVVYQNRMEDYNRLIEAMQEVKSAYNIKNNAVALMLVLDVYERHKDDILNVAFTERQEKDWIDLSLVLGTSRIPVEAAKVLNRAIDQMTARKEIKAKNRWQAIEYLSADYLGQ